MHIHGIYVFNEPYCDEVFRKQVSVFGFQERREIYWPAEQMIARNDEIYSTRFIGFGNLGAKRRLDAFDINSKAYGQELHSMNLFRIDRHAHFSFYSNYKQFPQKSTYNPYETIVWSEYP